MIQRSILFLAVLVAMMMFTSNAEVSTTINSNMFAGIEAMQATILRDLLKDNSGNVQNLLKQYTDNIVTFSPCPGSHQRIYAINDIESHTEPTNVKRNINVAMVLEGIMKQNEHVDLLHLDVTWNGHSIYSENHKLSDDVKADQPYELKLSWFIPIIAPSGSYNVDLVVKSGDQELGCERASFTL